MTDIELIDLLQRQDARAQRAFYDRFAPRMFGVCKRYVATRENAQDVLVEALYKALANIEQFQGAGSFEGWVRRIVVNESLMFLRKQHRFTDTGELDDNIHIPQEGGIEHDLAAADIMSLLDTLPTGYRTIFNLYVIEGYKHREIAEILGISINTSKSQLIMAKERLQVLVTRAQQTKKSE